MKKVLLLQDAGQRRQVLEEELRKRGHEVVPVATGAQALRVLMQRRFDLLAVNLELADGGLDGMGVLERVRESRRSADLPALVFSFLPERELPGVRVFELPDVPDAVDEDLHSLPPPSRPDQGTEPPRSVPTRTLPLEDPLESQVDPADPEQLEEEVLGFQVLLRKTPGVPQLLESLALRLYLLKRDEELEPICKQLIELGHDLVNTWFTMGDALYRMGREDEAIDAWRFCIECDAGDPLAEKALRRIDIVLLSREAREESGARIQFGRRESEPPKQPDDYLI